MSKRATDYLDYYRSEIGERKFRKIIKEVETAKRFNHLMKSSAEQRAQPSAKDFFEYIMNSLKYSFAGKEKLIAMALLLLNRWDNEVNAKYKISNEYKLDMTVEGIFSEGNQLGV